MKSKNSLIFVLELVIAINFLLPSLFAQPGTITLTFSGDNNGILVNLDTVWVKNLTQNCDTNLYAPNLMLIMDTLSTGITSHGELSNSFSVSQNFPNPFKDQTKIVIYLPEKERIEIQIRNILGQQISVYSGILNAGQNTFQFIEGNERIYLLSVKYRNGIKIIRMIASSSGINQEPRLLFLGSEGNGTIKSGPSKNYFQFNPGDKLLFVGYAETEESGIPDIPSTNKDYVFQYATNIPCIGMPNVNYEGQTYNTVQIYSQCWLKENLNVGTMLPSSQSQSNNNIIEKYCMGDMASYCSMFGGLYFWNEMMKYTNETGGQGICPDGWHVPDDMEWQIVEGAVDSVFGIGNPQWGNTGWRGSDAGGNLKQAGTSYWEPPNTGATNAFGFTALPAGYYVQNSFWGPGYKTYFWSSSYPQKHFRNIDWNQTKVNRISGGDGTAISVRCVKN